jgi:predicted nucleic acid-binding Zn ribbon protein
MLIDATCKACNKTQEVLVKREQVSRDGSVDPEIKCSECNGELKKSGQLSASNFQLVGKGWARDSYS